MDRQRTFFYGFIMGVVFMMFPIPSVSVLGDLLVSIQGAIQIIGLILFIVCSIPLLINTYKAFINQF
jgi:ABC-type proline/glycine betaine transport system permease subunit